MLFKCFAFRRRDHERDHGLISLTSPGRGFLEKMIGQAADGIGLPGQYRLARRAYPPDVEIADLLAQGIPVQPQKSGGLDLIASRGGEHRGNHRIFDLTQDPVIESGGRQARTMCLEKLGEMPLHRVGKRRARLGFP